jgi:hypothetical protein
MTRDEGHAAGNEARRTEQSCRHGAGRSRDPIGRGAGGAGDARWLAAVRTASTIGLW